MSRRKPLRVLLLFALAETPQAPEIYEETFDTDPHWKTERDVLAALRALGHDVHLGPIHRHPREIIDLVERVKPDVVWNSVEWFQEDRRYETHVTAVLELLRVPTTGAGLQGHVLCKDKALTKKVLRHSRIHVPRFVVSRLQQPLRAVPAHLFPAFVKPLAGEGSEGISHDSFAEDAAHALRRAAFLHERFHGDVIIEQYIAGREIYVGALGNGRLKVLPPRELRFAKVPEGEPTYASYSAKWDSAYQKRWGIESEPATDLPAPVLADIDRTCRKSCRVLALKGWMRLDLRVTPEGHVYVMEANPNPDIGRDEDFALSARDAGIPYEELIDRLLRLALDALPRA